MSYNDFTDVEIGVGKPVKKSLWQKLKDNFTSHEDRITALEGGGSSKLVLFNGIIETDKNRVGDIKFSLLSTTQYQNLHSADWNTLTGQSLSGKDLASYYGATCINAGGRFPRISGTSGVGAIGIGTLQGQQNYTHGHDLQFYGDKSGGGSLPECVVKLDNSGNTADGLDTWHSITSYANGYRLLNQGGNEARPDSAVIGAYVKENDYDLTRISLFKAPYDFNIISSIVTNIDAGNSGTLEMDVLTGSALSSVTSIFSTKPSVTSGAGNNASSSNAVISNPSVFENNWVRLDVTSLQTRQIRHHFFLLAELA